MKKSLIFAALIASASTVHAADVKRAPMAQNPWEGAYFGGNLGGALLHAEATVLYGIDVSGVKGDGRGVLGGVQGGINYSSGDMVFGVEMDASLSNATGEKKYNFLYDNLARTAKLESTMKGLITARARVGATVDRDTLLYATGGLAFGRFEQKITVTAIGSDSSSRMVTGYVLGAGVERSLGSGMSVKAEYLFSGFEKTYETTTVNNNLNIFRLGLNVKL